MDDCRPTVTDTGCIAAFPRETRQSRWLSEIHDESSQDEDNTLTRAVLPEIPTSRPNTEMIEDPETGATTGDMEDKEG